MRFMLFRQAQRPDQPVRREDMRLAMGRHQSLGVLGHIIALAQAREPVLSQRARRVAEVTSEMTRSLAMDPTSRCSLRATRFARAGSLFSVYL